MVSKIPAIPSLPAGVDPQLTMFLQSLKSAVDVIAGQSSAGAITQADLDKALAELDLSGGGGTTIIGGGGGGGTDPNPPDYTPPSALTGLTVTPGFSSVFLEWDALPPYPQIAFVTVYRASVDDINQAAAVGTCRVLIYSDFLPDSKNYYYWIKATTVAGVEGPPNSATGTLGKASIDPSYTKEVLKNAITDLEIAEEKLSGDGALKELTVQSANIADAAILSAKIGTAAIITAHIQDAAIIDAKIANLAADKIIATSLSAVTANLGTVTAGMMLSPDQTFRVDLNNKQILITGPKGQVADDYTIIQNGLIQTYEWTGTGHVLSKALRGLAVGIATNGATVTMSTQYFRNQPSIIVSPASIETYLTANSNQNQTLQCFADNITQVSAGIWQFRAVAQLALAGGTESKTLGYAINNSTSNTLTSTSATTTSSNASKLSVNVTVKSYRSTTTAGTFYFRKVTIYLQYRPIGGAWVNGASTVVNFPASEAASASPTLTTGNLTVRKYEVRIYAVYADAGGTFAGSGAGTTPQPPVTVTASNQTISRSGPGSPAGNFQLPAWSVANASNISVAYEYTFNATAEAEYLFTSGNNTASIYGTGGTQQLFATATANSTNPGTGNPVVGQGSGIYRVTGTGTYDRNKLGWSMSLIEVSGGRADGTLVATGIKAVINYNLPTTSGDTNPHNWLTWNTLIATLSGATVLSSGTLNWMAIGEG